ncbi:unnamed protein product [Caenorhabditis auriculariae]|uniref:Uncharacterized protein n=1 Tax=Caenorhabditis auriculariae TaxID=2777116 RepID=A0A8S1H9D7_9PELO|nr:unnamed protein product [Caenorhabditis auriculariae]
MPWRTGEPHGLRATAMISVFLFLALSQAISAYVVGTGVSPNGNGCVVCEQPTSQWGTWSEWAACSTAYGTPTQSRTRNCPAGNCQGGSSMETKPCVMYDPQPTPEWNAWGAWSSCSASCGGGSMTRTRVCNNGCSVCQCVGSSSETQVCNSQPCCTWTAWSSWSACSTSCGNNGVITRSRQCSCYSGCVGTSNEQQPCSNQPACPTTCSTCQPQYNPPPPPPPPCTTCSAPVPPPVTCTTCNQQPTIAPCSTCGAGAQPFYDPYGNGRKKRSVANASNSTVPV